MKQQIFTLAEQVQLAPGVMKMVLCGDTSEIRASGQFVNLKIDGFFLRRPISVCDWNENELILIYKIVGNGTQKMSTMLAGEKIDVLTGLGNGYNTEKSGENPLLIGGGAGVPPMFHLCRELIASGKKPTVILGFNTKSEIFYANEFEKLGVEVIVTTVDGSFGVEGFVTNAMQNLSYSYTYCCGPEPMLKAVWSQSASSGEYSFEERMGCGFGACVGCTCKTKYGNKRICKDGPVLVKEEIIW